MNRTHRWPQLLLAGLTPLVLLVAGCGGGSSGPDEFTLGGSISGLTSSGLVLANGSDTLAVAAGASRFTLPTAVNRGNAYSVAVQTQPTGQTCSVTGGSGTMGGADVSNVAVTCVANVYSLGGSVSGLAGSGLVLANGSDTLAVDANAAAFSMPTAVAFGDAYAVTVQTQPPGLTCSVAQGSGTMGAADVSNVSVTCSALSFTLGGSISGLTASGLVLANGSDTVSVVANSTTFTLPAPVAFGSAYDLSVRAKAAGQTCTIAGGSGIMGAGDVSSIAVSCGTATFSVKTFAGIGKGLANGNATVARFSSPRGAAVDGSGNVYVADADNNMIRKITPAGVVSTFAGSGATGNDDGSAATASFNRPRNIAVGADGSLYVADQNNHEIRKIAADGTVSTLAGSTKQGKADGAGSAASFSFPFAVAVDGSGNVYVTDGGNNKVRKIAPDGTVSTVAGSGSASSTDGIGTAATFNSPTGIAVDASGDIYVAEAGGNRIRRITPAGAVTTLAGSGTAGRVDGTGTAASFNAPQALAIDGDGHLFLADSLNNTIRKITRTGVVSTLAGTGVAGVDNGAATGATFSNPSGVAVDGSGNVFVADNANNRIREITQD